MHTNRLAHEKSPYLLQHAHNPVNWYPWGEEAFAKARAENKPIFLSIGYSTCHWCHVMERESFENEQIAALLNRDYVSIKVDREERPDVDRIYMTFVQASTGSGGWPMSVWLTPELEPFFGGTYFPPENRWGNPGFPAVLRQIAEAWRNDRAKIAESARDAVSQLEKHVAVEPARPGAANLTPAILDTGFRAFSKTFDAQLGGFGGAPKFPRPSVHNFLLREYVRTQNESALDMVLFTLREMAKGGMNDQLGGGFHRYAVDDRWFLPHFEKMLYDQAQLAISYLEAFQITRDPQYADIARRTLDYVLRDMTDPEGGFYSAEDADSVIDPAHPDIKGEGAFYIWSTEEIRRLVEGSAADWFCFRFGVCEHGNVEHDPHGEFTGKNILYQAHTIGETAEKYGRATEEIRLGIARAAAILLEARGKRVRPHLDDKVLTSWNGMMISAFALAGAALDHTPDGPRYAEAARRAAEFLTARMYNPETGTLLRRYRAGEAAIPGFLDDYAFFIQALIDLYEAQFDRRHLELAQRLMEKQRELFEDREHGAFFSTAADEADIVLRVKDDYDGAEPSANSISVMNLLRLAQIGNRADYRELADRSLAAFERRLAFAPAALPQMLVSCGAALSEPRQIVLVGERESPDTRALIHELHSHFVPNRVALLIDSDESRRALASNVPAFEGMRKLDGHASAYVCSNYACKLPVSEASELAELLQ
jgi:uncharacterized protein YyaL (SSP411 family)